MSGGGLGDFINARDMFDGGGAGKAGPEFEGGAISPLLNQLGIKPAGYRDRMQGQARPPMASTSMGVPAPAPVQVTPLPPQQRPMTATAANYGPPGMMTPGGPPSVAPNPAGMGGAPMAPSVMANAQNANAMQNIMQSMAQTQGGDMMMDHRGMQRGPANNHIQAYYDMIEAQQRGLIGSGATGRF